MLGSGRFGRVDVLNVMVRRSEWRDGDACSRPAPTGDADLDGECGEGNSSFLRRWENVALTSSAKWVRTSTTTSHRGPAGKLTSSGLCVRALPVGVLSPCPWLDGAVLHHTVRKELECGVEIGPIACRNEPGVSKGRKVCFRLPVAIIADDAFALANRSHGAWAHCAALVDDLDVAENVTATRVGHRAGEEGARAGKTQRPTRSGR